MDFELTSSPDSPELEDENASPAATEFRISQQPLVTPNEHVASSQRPLNDELPRSYGTQTLALLPRDPYTLFAYWDVDWEKAFDAEPPPDHKVHLRILDSDGAVEATMLVEPMGGSCPVAVSKSNTPYTAEIGWFKTGGAWQSVAKADAATTPPDGGDDAGPMELTTIPFHLTFQRMIDLLRVPKHEQGALAGILGELRERVAAAGAAQVVSGGEGEVARAIEDAVAGDHSTMPNRVDGEAINERPIDRWNDAALKQSLGIGTTSSPTGGFTGSSRTA